MPDHQNHRGTSKTQSWIEKYLNDIKNNGAGAGRPWATLFSPRRRGVGVICGRILWLGTRLYLRTELRMASERRDPGGGPFVSGAGPDLRRKIATAPEESAGFSLMSS
ncbi:hypothetical protein GWI33_017706 [Rhynchophorus ferrugineus]|uniref:Uncharacterized protein n=1 Tax=Rhynchophorus ferrugineus TaxID=354439 RepID=A0A834M7D7_RHYFE|nr:hypothetical protein GWI33_017706 [Rhynchophorus ferrugineus]